LPLHEIISVVVGVGVNSKKVWGEYDKIIENFENEFNVLLYAEKEELIKSIPEKIVDLILKNREGKIDVKPGYDGVYGEIDFDGKG